MKKNLTAAFLISIASALVVAALSVYPPAWLPFDKKIYDLKYSAAVPAEHVEEIVIVDIDTTTLKKLGRYQNWPRAYYAEVIASLSGARVLGIDVFFGEPDTLPVVAQKYYTKPNFDSLVSRAIESSGNVVLVSSYDEEPIFKDACTTGIGEVNADNDGVVRTGYRTTFGKKTFAYQVAVFANPDPAHDRFKIRFVQSGSFRHISFSDVYFNRVPLDFFDGKIVLIGGSAPGLFDYHAVPFARRFPGIEIQANLINNFIKNQKINDVPYVFILISSFLLALLMACMIITRSAKAYLFVCAAVFIAVLVVSFIFLGNGSEFGIMRPYYTFLLTIVASLVYRYRFEEREKKKIKSIFSRYYSKELVEKVITQPPKLGGEKVECSILFADIRNFTPYAEKSSPEEVGVKLNRFLTEMVMIVFKYQGRIDKFIGDCVMAVFGSPVKLKNSAFNACLAAREMVKRAKELGFQIGAGINTGEVISGNFGSPMRMEYTVIGDAVNLAARLETLTKEFNVNIIVSDTTCAMARKNETVELPFRDLGKAKVKGKEEELVVYELK
jgi:class 3 adenylate cyclase